MSSIVLWYTLATAHCLGRYAQVVHTVYLDPHSKVLLSDCELLRYFPTVSFPTHPVSPPKSVRLYPGGTSSTPACRSVIPYLLPARHLCQSRSNSPNRRQNGLEMSREGADNTPRRLCHRPWHNSTPAELRVLAVEGEHPLDISLRKALHLRQLVLQRRREARDDRSPPIPPNAAARE